MFFGILFLIIGIGWILQYYGYIPADMDFFWPVIFIVIGLSIIFGRKRGWDCCNFWDKNDKKKE